MFYWLSHRVTEGKENKKSLNFQKRQKYYAVNSRPYVLGPNAWTKRNLVRALADAFVQTAGSAPDAVDVILVDV